VYVRKGYPLKRGEGGAKTVRKKVKRGGNKKKISRSTKEYDFKCERSRPETTKERTSGGKRRTSHLGNAALGAGRKRSLNCQCERNELGEVAREKNSSRANQAPLTIKNRGVAH